MVTIEEKFRAEQRDLRKAFDELAQLMGERFAGEHQDMRAMIVTSDLKRRLDKPAKPRLVGGRDTKKDVCHG